MANDEVEKLFREWSAQDPGCLSGLNDGQIQRMFCFVGYVLEHQGGKMKSINAKDVVEFLNGLLAIDRDAVSDLFETRVHCSDALAGHPTVVVRQSGELCTVALLGVLNGMLRGDGETDGPIARSIVGADERIEKFCLVGEAANG